MNKKRLYNLYNYKIQWILKPTEAFKLIKILGVRSLDFIALRDYHFKEVDRYDGFIQFPYGLAETETIKYLKKQIKKYMKENQSINPDILSVEVVRK